MSSGGAGVAKTVSFSPLRPDKTSIKITLDAPYQLKWPHIAPENVERLLEQLKNSLSGVKALLSSKFNQTPSNDGKRNRRKRARKRKTRKDKKEAEAGESEEIDREPPAKRICQEASSTTADDGHPVAVIEATQSVTDESADMSVRAAPQSVQDNGKRAQLVVGTNAVTRSLEEGSLRVGVVCLTAKPALVHHHLLQLAATRQVPMAALPSLSPTIAPLLGMKSCLAIGIKKVGEGEVDCYPELVDAVTKLAPPIPIPWLTSDPSGAGDKWQTKAYLELNVKKTITRPKRKNKPR